MMPKPLPAEYLIDATLSWSEALFGVQEGWADPRLLILLAERRLSTNDGLGDDEIQLAGLRRDEHLDAVALAKRLSARETYDAVKIQAKWQCLILRWLYDKRDQFPDPLGIVEIIFADFGYPSSMESFVRFMPAADGYDPQAHSRADNERRLIALWGQYANSCGQGHL